MAYTICYARTELIRKQLFTAMPKRRFCYKMSPHLNVVTTMSYYRPSILDLSQNALFVSGHNSCCFVIFRNYTINKASSNTVQCSQRYVPSTFSSKFDLIENGMNAADRLNPTL